MDIKKLLEIREHLIQSNDYASKALTDYCKPFKGPMGLVSDECRNSEIYKNLKAVYGVTWKSLREFNRAFSKNKELQKAIKDQIMQRRMAKLSK